jgi:DNA-binding CsgD family transcriptional regulator
VAVARWVAEQHDARWLTWRAHALLAGCAHLDGDLAAARHHREVAAATGAEFSISGTAAANTLLLVEEVLDRDDVDEMAAFVVADDEPAVEHPLGRLALAYREARVGRPESAERSLRIALRQIDEEGSYLLVACRAVAVVRAMSDGTTVHPSVADVGPTLVEILEPWSRHVAVDSYGLWCEGPVSLALAELHHLSGNPARARVLLSFATHTARDMHDVRAMARVDRLADRIGDASEIPPGEGFGLTDRELAVLSGIVAGKTNPAIAAELAFSLSTIRNDTTEIFRKLGVTRRREAAAKAVAVGLVGTD